MVPPQERPTFQAVSSATPNSSTLGLPFSITSMASVTTAPSTQPPETEPRKLPSWSITRLEPTGRGAEPQVSTTVANATPLPSRRQSSAALRISSSRASIFASPVLNFALPPSPSPSPRSSRGEGRGEGQGQPPAPTFARRLLSVSPSVPRAVGLAERAPHPRFARPLPAKGGER